MDRQKAVEYFVIILIAVVLLTWALQSIKPSLVVVWAVVATLAAAFIGLACWLTRRK